MREVMAPRFVALALTYPLAMIVPTPLNVPAVLVYSVDDPVPIAVHVGAADQVAPIESVQSTGFVPVTRISTLAGLIKARLVMLLNVVAGRIDSRCVAAPLAAVTVASGVDRWYARSSSRPPSLDTLAHLKYAVFVVAVDVAVIASATGRLNVCV